MHITLSLLLVCVLAAPSRAEDAPLPAQLPAPPPASEDNPPAATAAGGEAPEPTAPPEPTPAAHEPTPAAADADARVYSPRSEQRVPRVVVLAPHQGDEGDAALGASVRMAIEARLARNPAVEVVSVADVPGAADLQTADCFEGAAICMADVATAVGADLVVFSSVEERGDARTADVGLFSVPDARVHQRIHVVGGAREELVANAARTAGELVRSALVTSRDRGVRDLVVAGGIGASVGVGLLVAGAATGAAAFLVTQDDRRVLDGGPTGIQKKTATDLLPFSLAAAAGGVVMAAVGVTIAGVALAE